MTSVLLPEPETPVTQVSVPSGTSKSIPLRLLPRAPTRRSALVPARRLAGIGIESLPGEVLARQRVRVAHDLLGRPRRDELPAVLAGARPEVDDVVRRRDRRLVVLDDEHGVAQVAQPLERAEEPVVVALVQADARLVQHVEHADQPRADLGRQPDALPLAAGERGRLALERQIPEADVGEELQALADLLEHPLGDRQLGRRQIDLAKGRDRVGHRERGAGGDAPAAEATASASGLSRRPLQAGQLCLAMKRSISSRIAADFVSR